MSSAFLCVWPAIGGVPPSPSPIFRQIQRPAVVAQACRTRPYLAVQKNIPKGGQGQGPGSGRCGRYSGHWCYAHARHNRAHRAWRSSAHRGHGVQGRHYVAVLLSFHAIGRLQQPISETAAKEKDDCVLGDGVCSHESAAARLKSKGPEAGRRE